jgi:hypothetical protein
VWEQVKTGGAGLRIAYCIVRKGVACDCGSRKR